MGCDGGTIPKRDELVRTKKKPEQKDRDAELQFRWCHCALSQEVLVEPILACELGRLYNKEAIIEVLLSKSSMPEWAKHIRNMKDLKAINLTENPSYEKDIAKKGDAYVDRQIAQYICPVLSQEMNGRFKFCFLWTCGCVMSERSLKEIKVSTCHKCGQHFTESDIINLNPLDDDVDVVTVRMEARRARVKGEKIAKRRKAESPTTVTTDESKIKKYKINIVNPAPSTSGGSAATVQNGTKLVSTLKDPSYSKVTPTYQVAKDPQASDVYKSIFTSHHTAETQQKAHWITYNPFYN